MKKTKSKTNKKHNNRKRNIIITSCITILVIILVITTIIINQFELLNDSFFVSDDNKYVISLNIDDTEYEDNEYMPIEAYLVYFYSGDHITSFKIYYKYANTIEASNAYNQIYVEDSNAYNEIYRDGKYVVLVADKSEYEGIKASDVKKQIDLMEILNSTHATNSIPENE